MSYPITAEMLLSSNSKSNNGFALIACVKEDDTGIYVNIVGDASLAVMKTHLQRAIRQELGITLPLRNDIITGTTELIPNHYLLGAGSLLELKYEKKDFILLLQRNDHAPSNAGKWTNPSGMCNATPMVTAYRELLEESGIVGVSLDKSMLILYVPILIDGLNNSKDTQEIMSVKQDQELNVRSRLPRELQSLPMTYHPLLITPLPLPEHTKKVYLKLPNDETYQLTNFMLTYDLSIQGVTLTMRYVAQLPSDMTYYSVDPEPFRRSTALVTPEVLHSLKCNTVLEHARLQGIVFYK